jgi:hypothetical protein
MSPNVRKITLDAFKFLSQTQKAKTNFKSQYLRKGLKLKNAKLSHQFKITTNFMKSQNKPYKRKTLLSSTNISAPTSHHPIQSIDLIPTPTSSLLNFRRHHLSTQSLDSIQNSSQRPTTSSPSTSTPTIQTPQNLKPSLSFLLFSQNQFFNDEKHYTHTQDGFGASQLPPTS